MATFTCSECNFSKQVADEMAGKKARCPKCNAVNDIPPLEAGDAAVSNDSVTSEAAPADTEAGETGDSAPTSAAPTAAASAPAAEVKSQESAAAPGIKPIPKNWLMMLGGAAAMVLIAAVLFVLQWIDVGIVCFAIGILAFAALSAMYCFKN